MASFSIKPDLINESLFQDDGEGHTLNNSGYEKQYCSRGTSSEEDTEQPNSKKGGEKFK